MRKVPLKNYLILLVISVVTIALTLYLADFYKERNKKTTSMHKYISEITEKELTDYIIEKPTIFMYISDKYDMTNDKLEKDLINEIKRNNLKDYFVYLNSGDLTSDFENFFETNYNLKFDINRTPILILINDGQIEDINYLNINNYNVKEIINFEAIK